MFEGDSNGKGRILKDPKALKGLGEGKSLTGLILVASEFLRANPGSQNSVTGCSMGRQEMNSRSLGYISVSRYSALTPSWAAALQLTSEAIRKVQQMYCSVAQ